MSTEKNYINQNYSLIAESNKDLRGATVVRMQYTRPDESSGFWVAQIRNGNEVVYEANSTDINLAGWWIFYPYVEKGGKIMQGKSLKTRFYNPGE